jgi:hypothetical protein
VNHLQGTDLLIGALFFFCAFFTTFFLRKMFNLFLLLLLLFAVFTALEALRVIPAWAELQRLMDLTSSFGKTIMALIKTTITKGTVLSLMLFCMGGMAGLVIRQRG